MQVIDYFHLLVTFVEQYKLFSSFIFIAIAVFARNRLFKYIKHRSKIQGRDSRSSISGARNLSNFLLFIAILFLWAHEIQGLALSIAAFMVAIIFATREYIQCLLGFIYISSTRAFSVGDWIQINNISGEVTNKDWLKVTLLEIDMHNYSYTGKTLTFPNNMMISQPVKNMNFLKRYASHTFSITLEPLINAFKFHDAMLEKAAQHCSKFKDVANRYVNLIEKRLDVSITGPNPEMHITTNDIGKLVVTFTIFCPTDKAITIEQAITNDYMTMWFKAADKVRTPC